MTPELRKKLIALFGIPGPLLSRKAELPPGWEYGNDVDRELLAELVDVVEESPLARASRQLIRKAKSP